MKISTVFEKYEWVAATCLDHENLDNPVFIGLIIQALANNRVVTLARGIKGRMLLVSWLRTPPANA